MLCRCCPACHCNDRRPPRHHLRVLTTELEDEAVALAFQMAGLPPRAKMDGAQVAVAEYYPDWWPAPPALPRRRPAGVGLSSDTVARYGKCCEAVVEFCSRRGLDALSGSVVEEFVACQQERARCGEVGPNRRNALVKSARLMLEFQATGAVAWRMMSPDPDLALSESSRAVLKQFAAETVASADGVFKSTVHED